MNKQEFNRGLLTFLDASTSPFHAVTAMTDQLRDAGFQRLDEAAAWALDPGGRYFVCRNGSSLIAFVHGHAPVETHGIRMVGAHTDSPCLKIKPNPERNQHGYLQLGVEVYGGALLNPWFDRDLSIAGRVTGHSKTRGGTKKAALVSDLIDVKQPVAVIPSLAIHLDRKVNDERSINAQRHLPPLLRCAAANGAYDFREWLADCLRKSKSPVETVLDYELYLYDTQPANIIGIDGEFIASARLDNLLSCYAGMQALLDADEHQTALLVCTDHEEVGSASACGAQGPFLRSVLERMTASFEWYTRVVDRSVMVSADNAHAIHPNYADKHDQQHAPLLNAGPVIKVNANQRYATNSETAALFRQLCQQASVNVQSMVARTDMGCGSTIGPITATEVGVPTVDVGVPQLAMHSCRELAGADDCWQLNKVLKLFFERERLIGC